VSSWSGRRHADVADALRQQKIKFYVTSMVAQWVLAIGCLLVVWRDGQSLTKIGFRLWGPLSATVIAGFIVTAILAAMVALILWLQHNRRWRETDVLRAVLPETPREKTIFVAVAATAGFCEEMLYRGFAITRLALLTGGVWSAALMAVIAFSAGHFYQGAIGVWRAGLLGIVLAVAFILTGSLVPGMIAHFLIDALAGLWGRAWLEKNSDGPQSHGGAECDRYS
jgi:membrane protease YdiL (CAAX protease family)